MYIDVALSETIFVLKIVLTTMYIVVGIMNERKIENINKTNL